MKNKIRHVTTTDQMREVVLKLFDKGFDATEISNVLEISHTSVKRIIDAIKAARSNDPETIKEYKDSYAYTESNWNWAKAKFGAVSMLDDVEEYGSATAIEVLINQQRDILIELARIRTFLEEN